MLDVLIEGGELMDGAGAQRCRADIGITGDRVVAIGKLAGQPTRKRVNATGRIVAPGFIDVHTQDDCLLLHVPAGAHPKLSQGVTTTITGDCGNSLAPLLTKASPAPLDLLGVSDWRFDSVADYLDALEQSQQIANAACQAHAAIGQGCLARRMRTYGQRSGKRFAGRCHGHVHWCVLPTRTERHH